ncbi:MAG: cellulase family glycosylhydrolase [Candidatus Coatesbacteria bacterium]
MSRGRMFALAAAFGLVSTCQAMGTKPPDPSWSSLPRWRGFNLLEKFGKEWSNGPFIEDDFKLIHEWGFNFVRLPMDYRVWIVNGDWRTFDEKVLREIDQAVAWGKKYSVHVCINFHRAPGYTVAKPPEAKSLWTNPEAEEVCALHWGTFARRYKGIPNRELSFNLFNEPSDIDAATYVRIVKRMTKAIRVEDPDRLVICDGLLWGGRPVPELKALKVAQATRGYSPTWLTHYQASWMGDNAGWPLPTWPEKAGLNGFLYGPEKPELREPLVLRFEGGLAKSATLSVRVHTVSASSTLVVAADGLVIMTRRFVNGPGQGEWTKAVWREEWKVWQNVWDRDYTAPLAAGTREVTLENTGGDWLEMTGISVSPFGEGLVKLSGGRFGWGDRQPGAYTLKAGGIVEAERPVPGASRASLWRENVTPWVELRNSGVGVIVGEWGSYNKTPHPVVMAWMRDCLENWQQAGLGWALWNFRGSFGVLDSDRSDVAYEDFRGHKLDRRMLDLLRAH